MKLPAGHGELVLVVEDERPIREVTASILEEHGYTTLAADDGAQAVDVYVQNKDKIDVVLMDLMMPVMDGMACSRVLRKINPDVKIIMVSGLAEKNKLESIDKHIFLPKPYTAEKLIRAIYEATK